MKSAFAVAVLVAFATAAQSGVVNEPSNNVAQSEAIDRPLDDVADYSFVDSIVKAILEQLRPKISDLRIPAVNQSIQLPTLNASLTIDNILVLKLERFLIKELKSSLIPLRITNLTLVWEEIGLSFNYDVNVSVIPPPLSTPIRLFAKGEASVSLRDLFLTIGANVELKDKGIQIKPKGLFGFDLRVPTVNVTLSSVLGRPDLAEAVGEFLNSIIPELVDILKFPLFDSFRDDIIRIVNDFLRGNGTKYLLDEPSSVPEVSFESLDLSEEIDSFFRKSVDLGLDDAELGGF